MTFEVDFADVYFDAHYRAGIRDVLRRIQWGHPVNGVRVVRRFNEGVSGACVLQVRLSIGNGSRVKIVKMAPADETNREWHAYRQWIVPFTNAYCTPLPERTPDRDSGDPAREWTALVYEDVGQFAGGSVETVRTLEELGGGLDVMATAVDKILDGTKAVLHGRWRLVRERSSLRGLNPGLGPSLVLDLEGFSGHGARGGQPPPGRYDLLHHDEVLRWTASGGSRDIEVGARIAVSDLRVERRGGKLLAVDDEIEVELRAASDAGVGLGELVDGMTIAVWGKVAATRGRTHRDRMMAALGPAAGEHSTGDPFAILPDVLCDTRAGRVLAVCHGDLNLRNVMCVGDKLYLIDYARAGERAQPTDFCWLEVGIMRDVLAEHEFESLLRLQRCLALATVLMEIGYGADAVPPLVGPLVGAGMREAFELLFVVRRRAWSCYPEEAGPRFAEEYLRHLFLSTHRTMKWPDEWQTPGKVRASIVTAAVAAEWLNGENPFRHWGRPELSVALTALASIIPLRDKSAVRLVADLVGEIGANGTPDEEVERAVRTLATRLVGYRCGTAAQAFLVTHHRHDDFVDLPTSPSGPGVVRTLLNSRSVVLCGPAGSGKSTVALELAHRLAADIVAERPARMPVLVEDAREMSSLTGLLSGSGLAEVAEESFVLGAVHVIVDLPAAEDDLRLPKLVRKLQKWYPRTRIVVCRREVGAVAARVEELQSLDHGETVAWFRRALGDRADAEHLVNVLLDDPRWHWVDLGRPAWLSLVAGYVREHGLPAPVPMPHEVIALMPDRVDVKGDARLHQSYLRARELADGDADLVVGGVFRTGEWDAYRILATLPGTDPALVRRLADAVVDRHPVMAAELLCAASLDVSDFAARMLEMLRDPEAGPLRWRAAAQALSILGWREGTAGLARAAVSTTAPDDGARAAFAALGQLYDTTLPRPHRRDVATVLADVVRQVLENPELEPRWETALALVAQTGVPGLELHVAALVDEAQRWPVLRGAVQALRARGIALPPPLVATHTRARYARLAVLDATLPRLTTRAEINETYDERCRLITELVPTAPLPWLLRRRFAFDAHRRVADVIDKCIGRDPDYATLIEEGSAQDDEMTFRVMAYRLLRDTPETAGAELTRLPPDASATRLLVAAAAVPHADRSRVSEVADGFLALLPTVEADRLEGMAALVLAIHGRDRQLGVRLARLATDALAERDVRARHCWPWAEAITRIHAASTDLDAMLCGGGDVTRAAVSTLVSHDFHRSGRPGPLYRLSERARRLLRDMPRNVGWALAAGAVNMVEALPELLELVEESDKVSRRGSAHYGVFEQAEAADVLAVVGYLSRMAYEEGTMTQEVAAAQRFLLDFEVLGRHPSVAAGRLIGLAYLGEWQSILRADLSDPRLRDAARHAVTRWLPGPATPPGGESPLAVARWITERLRLQSIRTDQRWALDELRQCAERAAGMLVDR